MTKKKHQTPYDKFKVIMDKAAGESKADYQGHGKFWNTLSLEELQQVSIYGIRMIAPKEDFDPSGTYQAPAESSCCAPKSSCCEDKEDKEETTSDAANEANDGDSGGPVYFPGRGAASGLVIGLKGDFPFDDTQFPRLPFDGQQVSSEDIQFIEKWIDAGCPENEMPKASEASAEGPVGTAAIDNPLTRGEQSHEAVGNMHTYQANSGQLVQRKNAAYMPHDEREAFRHAIAETQALNKYPFDKRSFLNWGKIHGDSCQHGWEQFLPWHRAYLYEFEQLLQDYVPGVALPYWDWTLPQYQHGLVPTGGVSGIIPELYRCWLDEQSLENLKKNFDPSVINKLKPLLGTKYNSGTEVIWKGEDEIGKAEMTGDLIDAIYAELQKTNPLFHRYRYPGMFYQTDSNGNYILGDKNRPKLIDASNPMGGLFHHQYPTKSEIDDILEIDNWAEFGGGHVANQSFGILSQNPHNTGHIWSGGQNPMADPTQPWSETNTKNGDMFNDLVAFYDPIAWGHHSNVDRLWAKWQSLHPGKNPVDLTDIMIPWQYSIQQLLSISKLGYEYVKGSKMYPSNNNAPITKFKSAPAELHHEVVSTHARAEVRLHKVQKSVDSHYIRVFLNSPDADENTPIVDNDNYVGYIARFGHGDCVGGPGHCAVPSEGSRKFDMRARHHNTPTNHALNATKAVQKLIAKGEKDIHVNVVALGPDGRMAQGSSRLLMDGVSLNFFD